MMWVVAAAVLGACIAYCVAAAHGRRVERDQAEIADYHGYADLGDPLKRKGGAS